MGPRPAGSPVPHVPVSPVYTRPRLPRRHPSGAPPQHSVLASPVLPHPRLTRAPPVSGSPVATRNGCSSAGPSPTHPWPSVPGSPLAPDPELSHGSPSRPPPCTPYRDHPWTAVPGCPVAPLPGLRREPRFRSRPCSPATGLRHGHRPELRRGPPPRGLSRGLPFRAPPVPPVPARAGYPVPPSTSRVSPWLHVPGSHVTPRPAESPMALRPGLTRGTPSRAHPWPCVPGSPFASRPQLPPGPSSRCTAWPSVPRAPPLSPVPGSSIAPPFTDHPRHSLPCSAVAPRPGPPRGPYSRASSAGPGTG